MNDNISPPAISPPAPPPWRPTCKLEVQQLIDWTNARLDDADAALELQQQELEAEQDWGPDPTPEEMRQQHQRLDFDNAKAAARHEDMKPLRKLYPEIAEFINPPTREPSKHRRKVDWRFINYRTRRAIDDVYRIRHIWKRHYKKWKRPDNDPVSAAAIAADRHRLTKAAVLYAMNHGVLGLRFSKKLPPCSPSKT
jgi:hypothetical protein